MLYIFSVSTLKYLLLSIVLSLAACGGGDTSSEETDDMSDISQTSPSGITIPGLDEPNIRYPDLVIDSNGLQHAVAADIDGNVFYARCDSSCEQVASWSSTNIVKFNFSLLSTDAIVPKIQISSNNQPRVMVFATNTVLSSNPSYYYECNLANCLSTSAWQGQEAFSAIAVRDYDYYRASPFSLTSDDKPRVSWLSTPAVLSVDDDALFYASCDDDCATNGVWRTEVIQTFDLSSATIADMVIDNAGVQHIAFLEKIIGSDTVDITYISCSNSCDSSAPLWTTPVVLKSIDEDILELLSIRLFLTPADKPAVAVYDPLPDANVSLTLFSCTSDCSSMAGWESIAPINLTSFGSEDIASFGLGLDADFIDGNLTLQFIAKRRTDPLSSLLYHASCSSDCDLATSWSLKKVADTSKVQLEDEGICQFVGVEVGAPTTITVQAVSYEMVPYWYCGSFDFIEIDDSGNRELVSNPDIRFLEIATVEQIVN